MNFYLFTRLPLMLLLALGSLALAGPHGITQEEVPVDLLKFETAKLEVVADGHLVVARNGATPAIVILDPATGKEVKTVAKFAKGVGVDHVALSADRKHVAFASQLNNRISIFRWNIFVLDLPTGEVNQITTDQATNKGLAKPRAGEGMGKITGRLVWKDEEKGGLSDQFNFGRVQVDGSEAIGFLKDGGKFTIENIACSKPFSNVLIYANAMLPRTSKNEMGMAQTSLAVNVKPGETTDVGDLQVSKPAVSMGYGYPTWTVNGLAFSAIGYTGTYFISYPERKTVAVGKSVLDHLFMEPAGAVVSPDGAHVAGADKWCNNDVNNYKVERCIELFDGAGKHDKRVSLGDPSVNQISAQHHGTWLKDSSMFLTPGWTSDMENFKLMIPCVFAVTPAGEAGILKQWPEYATKADIVSITPDAAGKTLYLVVQSTDESGVTRGDVFAWTRESDELKQITQWGDVQSISNCGR